VALSLEDIARGVEQPEIREIVLGAMMNRVYLAYAVTTGTDPMPAKRRALEAAIVAAPDAYVTRFAFMSLSTTTITTLDDYTPTVGTSTINQSNFDMMADLIIPTESLNLTTQARGLTAVGAAVTAVTSIAHGLGVTPTADDFWFAFAADPLAAGHCWASAITSTTFTLNTKAAPGGAGTTVAWSVAA
jgi:hypothetical protein